MSQIVGYIKPVLKAAFEIGFIALPSLKAATCVAAVGSKALAAAKGQFWSMIDEDSPMAMPFTYYSSFKSMMPMMPCAMIEIRVLERDKDGKEIGRIQGAAIMDLVKDAGFYTLVAIVSTYAAHRCIGTSGICNTFFKFTGNGLRLDKSYNVIPMLINYISSKAK
ncbi:MAG: hypothetical protein ACRDFB_09540 [Rhabdochlamydiaceae bacterium]